MTPEPSNMIDRAFSSVGTMPLFASDWHAEAARKCGRALTAPKRDGATYDHDKDGKRLGEQHRAVFDLMRDGQWRTLSEIEDATGHPQASISARLRDFRKARFGGHEVNRRRRADAGTWQYQLILS